MGTKEAEISN